MSNATLPARAHVIAGGFPPGAMAGHDHDYARLRLLELLRDAEVRSSVANDFMEIGKWLDTCRLLITYTAGPYPDAAQNQAIRAWLASGGHWLGLHGTSGGRAVRIAEGQRRRRMLKADFHDTLGAFFLNHPPIKRLQVRVADSGSVLTRNLPQTFETVDEPYMIEVQHPDTRVLLTSEFPDASPEGFGFVYEADTALQPDGRTRVLGLTREIGRGGVTYIALGHCHAPGSNTQPFVDASVEPSGATPTVLRGSWETEAYQRLLRNAIDWGMGA